MTLSLCVICVCVCVCVRMRAPVRARACVRERERERWGEQNKLLQSVLVISSSVNVNKDDTICNVSSCSTDQTTFLVKSEKRMGRLQVAP
jgi:hypothetical protein